MGTSLVGSFLPIIRGALEGTPSPPSVTMSFAHLQLARMLSFFSLQRAYTRSTKRFVATFLLVTVLYGIVILLVTLFQPDDFDGPVTAYSESKSVETCCSRESGVNGYSSLCALFREHIDVCVVPEPMHVLSNVCMDIIKTFAGKNPLLKLNKKQREVVEKRLRHLQVPTDQIPLTVRSIFTNPSGLRSQEALHFVMYVLEPLFIGMFFPLLSPETFVVFVPSRP
jgi:hypothetical protein